MRRALAPAVHSAHRQQGPKHEGPFRIPARTRETGRGESVVNGAGF